MGYAYLLRFRGLLRPYLLLVCLPKVYSLYSLRLCPTQKATLAEAPSLGHALPKATAENGGLYWTLRAETEAS